jgi:hypothetical protein
MVTAAEMKVGTDGAPEPKKGRTMREALQHQALKPSKNQFGHELGTCEVQFVLWIP